MTATTTGSGHMTIGTRGSDLALTQTRDVIRRLAGCWRQLTVRESIIQTTGDRRRDVSLAELGRTADHGAPVKGVFIKELEDALGDGRIDAAVHSLKDMPSELLPGFTLAAILPRVPVEDVLISRQPLPATADTDTVIARLPRGAVVATGSVRRACELGRLRPDLTCVDLRGNVPTRLRKLTADDAPDAIVLARAGLQRLGFMRSDGTVDAGRLAGFDLPALAMAVIDTDSMLPAAGQGAVAVECRAGDEAARRWLAALHDDTSAACVAAERAFLAGLGAGCDTPVGAHAEWRQGLENQPARLHMRCRLFDPARASWRESLAEGEATDPAAVAALALERLHQAPEVALPTR